MRDVVFISIVIAFFALALAYVRACAWIIGPDEQVTPLAATVEGDELDEVAA